MEGKNGMSSRGNSTSKGQEVLTCPKVAGREATLDPSPVNIRPPHP